MATADSLSTSLLENKLEEISTLSVAAKALLIQSIKPKTIAKGEYLLHEVEVCRHIFFVESGFVKTFHNKDGKEINLNFTLANNFVTELKSLRTEIPATVAICAVEKTYVWQIEKSSLLSLYNQSAEISELGRQLLETLLTQQEEHANNFKLQTPAERYHNLIANNPALIQKVSLTQLASYLGVARETLSRIRKQ